MTTTEPTADQVEAARVFLRDGVVRWLKRVLPIGHQPGADEHLKTWVDASGRLGRMIELDPDGRPVGVASVALPLFLTDLAVADAGQALGLTEEQRIDEVQQIEAEVLAAWPRVIAASGEVEFPTFTVETPAGSATLNPIGRALDLIEASARKK